MIGFKPTLQHRDYTTDRLGGMAQKAEKILLNEDNKWMIVQRATSPKSLIPRNIDKIVSDIQFPFETSFRISVSGCKLTILPDIQPANRIVIISGDSTLTRACKPITRSDSTVLVTLTRKNFRWFWLDSDSRGLWLWLDKNDSDTSLEAMHTVFN